MTDTLRVTPPLADPQRTAALVRCVPFALFIALLALRGLLADIGTGQAFDQRWLYGVQAAAALLPLLVWQRHYVELRAARWSAATALLSVAAGLAVFLIWIAPQPAWAHLGSAAAAFAPVDGNGARRWGLIAVRVSGAVLVAPVMEELFWRSFLMRWIDRRAFLALAPAQVSWLGILASSAVFALAHDLWLAGFVAGVVYALLYRQYSNIWYPIIAHATTNLALAGWVLWTGAWQYW